VNSTLKRLVVPGLAPVFTGRAKRVVVGWTYTTRPGESAPYARALPDYDPRAATPWVLELLAKDRKAAAKRAAALVPELVGGTAEPMKPLGTPDAQEEAPELKDRPRKPRKAQAKSPVVPAPPVALPEPLGSYEELLTDALAQSTLSAPAAPKVAPGAPTAMLSRLRPSRPSRALAVMALTRTRLAAAV
jgi:hypothetical protein